ncbi:glycosyltransferase [Paucibacter sp. O1-1]|nr:galactosyldiacylglycerol synthase [Paucibacter sp. O1-1]MDA3829421.1 glycosyltransferase [Paucibacter sp. O1-1]
MTTTLDLIYLNAGGGHRAAAQALEAMIRQQGRAWQVRCVNLVDMLDPQQRFQRLTGIAPEDLYNLRLARGWTLGLAQELWLLQALIRLGHGAIVKRLRRHWQDAPPDLVVSLMPNFNRALAEGLAEVMPGAPFVTVLTDMADLPPHFWIEPGGRGHLVCGTAKAVAQARAAGYPDAQIHRSSGMLIRPDFYRPLALDRRAERRSLGLDPDRPTGVVLFGGHGSMAMAAIERQLPDVQLILLCGHNKALAAQLRGQTGAAPRAVLEFTPEVRRYLQLADFFIGKPGPGCLSEAAQQGLPIVTFSNAWTLPQERYNAEWVQEQGLGVVSRSARQIRPAVLELMERLDEFKANLRLIDNRAVFELPEILADVLQSRAQAWQTAPAPLLAV